MTLVQLFVDNLLPIFVVAGAGYAAAVALKLEARPLSAVAFNLLLPCLTFRIVTEARVAPDEVMRMVGFTVTCLLAVASVALLIALGLRWPRERTSAFVLCALIPNTGNFGLSANLLAFGQAGLTQASIFFLTATMVTATLGVVVASLGRAGPREAFAGLVRVPAIWSVVLGLAVRHFGIHVPGPIHSGLELMAEGCVPLLLVILGVQMRSGGGRAPFLPVALSAGVRLVGGAALAFALAPLFGLSGPARQAGIFQAAAPTAVITTVLAAEYGLDPRIVTASVFVTTLLCPLTLTPLLAMLR